MSKTTRPLIGTRPHRDATKDRRVDRWYHAIVAVFLVGLSLACFLAVLGVFG